MGFRERLDAAADRIASVVSRVFVTAPDHPDRGGLTGDGGGRDDVDRSAGCEEGEEPTRDDPTDREGRTR